jgi:hypothetical protein
MGKIYKEDIGVVIRLNTNVDITEAASQGISVSTPDGEEIFWPAEVYNTTWVTYTTEDGDLDDAGDYLLQSYAKWSDDSIHRGETYTLTVYEHYE